MARWDSDAAPGGITLLYWSRKGTYARLSITNAGPEPVDVRLTNELVDVPMTIGLASGSECVVEGQLVQILTRTARSHGFWTLEAPVEVRTQGNDTPPEPGSPD